MSAADHEAQARAVMWPTSGRAPWSVFAILDAARNPAIYPAVKAAGLPYTCLYSGKLPEVLAQAAPYLVKLEKDSDFTKRLLQEGWGDHWGIFALANATLEEVRRHFKRLLKVKDPQGKTLIFRFYDPRVLRVVLPTCEAGELATMFGPVRMFVQAGERGEVLSYFRDGSGLGVQEAPAN